MSNMDDEQSPQTADSEATDNRLYVPDDNWEAKIRRSGDRFYCYGKFAGEDWHHQIVTGEIYLQRGDEKFCLSCAIRQKVVTADRLYWQHLTKDPNRRPLI